MYWKMILMFKILSFLIFINQCNCRPKDLDKHKDIDSSNLKKELQNLLKRLLLERKDNDVKQIRGKDNETTAKADTKSQFTVTDIDTKHVDKNSDLEDLLETMSCNGNKAAGIHPELKDTVKAMKTEEQYEEQQSSNNTDEIKRNFVPPTISDYITLERRWNDATIPYYVDIAAFGEKYQDSLLKVLAETEEEYRQKTCVNLFRIYWEDLQTKNYKYFVNVTNLQGCYSVIGKQTWGAIYDLPPGQIISLQEDGCIQTRTAIHEFGHALGMSHEQKRSDRDEHIVLNWNSIDVAKKTQFTKDKTLDRNAYDYHSIMQYGLKGFAAKSWLNTMHFRDPDLEFLAGHSKRLTFYDVMDITTAYNCTKDCEFNIPCLNNGFLDHNCACYCPEGTTGKHCEKILSADDGCGDVIDLVPGEAITITSPNYPNNYTVGKICYWLLRAENPHQRVMIEVEDFDVAHNKALCRCYHWLEVRYNLLGQPGPKYCGFHFERNKISTTEFGNAHMMMLIFDSATVSGANATKGFRLKAQAIEPTGQGCTGEPPKVPNSSNDFHDIRASFGAVITYTCDYNYQMLGKGSVTCEADGTWSKERFRCAKKDPVFTCNFEDGKCGITSKGPYSWMIEGDENNLFFTVSQIHSPNRTIATLTIPYLLRADITYCLSFFFQRYDDNEPCASLYIGQIAENYFPWIYPECKETGFTHFMGDFGPYNKDIHMEFIAYVNNGGYFNMDIDEIILKEGSC